MLKLSRSITISGDTPGDYFVIRISKIGKENNEDSDPKDIVSIIIIYYILLYQNRLTNPKIRQNYLPRPAGVPSKLGHSTCSSSTSPTVQSASGKVVFIIDLLN